MISLNEFNISKVNEGKNVATFEIGPLPQGYGNTLGVFLRRVLLSSIPGSGITAVKLDGVQHEYSSLQGVHDDALTILLSIKNVVVVSKSVDPINVTIEKKGKAGEVVEVKAGDISEDANIEVINPEYVIARLTGANAKFKAELTIERGVGYIFPKEDLRKELSTLPLDANFSPVKLVNYNISQTRVGKETELDQLNITIQTNGAVTPVEALHVATEILTTMTNQLISLTQQMLSGNEVTVAISKQEQAKKELAPETNEKPIKVEDLNLSTRLTNALLKSNYDDLRKLEGLTEEEIANIRGMGSKSFSELLDILKKYNIKLL